MDDAKKKPEPKNRESNQPLLQRVPPYFPLIWQDWRSSPTVRRMTHTQRGIYLDMLVEQWISGSIPRDAWQLSKLIGSDYKTTVRLLEKSSKVEACCQCGASWTPVTCQCGASDLTATCHNPKLSFLKIDVLSGLPLGTTESNQDQTERKGNSSCADGAATATRKPKLSCGSAIEDRTKDKTQATATPTPATDAFVRILGIEVVDEDIASCNEALARIQEGHAHIENVMAHLAGTTKYLAGFKAVVKFPKWVWFAEKFSELADHMEADEVMKSKRKPVVADHPPDAPQYLQKPNIDLSKRGKKV